MNILIKEVKDPEILVITPLWTGHKISKATKKTIKRNDVPYTWITSENQENIPTNLQNGLNWYKEKRGKLPSYYFMLDRDVVLGRHLLDRLYKTLENAIPQIAFAYASFGFRGHMNLDFEAKSYYIKI